METKQKNVKLVLKLYDAFSKKEISKILEMLSDYVE